MFDKLLYSLSQRKQVYWSKLFCNMIWNKLSIDIYPTDRANTIQLIRDITHLHRSLVQKVPPPKKYQAKKRQKNQLNIYQVYCTWGMSYESSEKPWIIWSIYYSTLIRHHAVGFLRKHKPLPYFKLKRELAEEVKD